MSKLTVKVGTEVNETVMALDSVTYKWWWKALRNDDMNQVQKTLQTADDAEKDRLLNGTFHHQQRIRNSCIVESLYPVNFQLTRPWCIAGVASAHAVMGLMLANNSDVQQKDIYGNNIVHTLIMAAFLEPSIEEEMDATYTYLKEVLSFDQLKMLLDEGNDDGFKPLEYAAHLEVFVIMQSIFKTEGIYLIKEEETRSMYTMEWYIITDYVRPDKFNRYWFSPLYPLMMLDKKKLTDKSTKQLFASPAIQNWVQIKIWANMPIIIVWCIIRILFVASFMLTDHPWTESEIINKANESNVNILANKTFNFQTNTTDMLRDRSFASEPTECTALNMLPISTETSLGFYIYLMAHCLIVIVLDITEIFTVTKRSKHMKTPRGCKDPMVTYLFYRIIQFLQAVIILTYLLSKFLALHSIIYFPATVDNLMYISISMSFAWSFLFFFQLMPWIGHFIVVVVNMLMTLLKFMLIFCIFSIPFIGSFQRLMNAGKTKGNCPKEFSSVGYSFYTVFTMMLNMIEFHKFSPSDPTSVFILHTMYVFLTAILLVNFLIALFSMTILHINDHKQIVQTVQRLSVCWLIEERMQHWLCPTLYRWLSHRTFPTISDGVYAVPCEIVCKKEQEKLDKKWSERTKIFCP